MEDGEKCEVHDFHQEDLRTFRTLRAGVEVRVYEDTVLLDTVLESISSHRNEV